MQLYKNRGMYAASAVHFHLRFLVLFLKVLLVLFLPYLQYEWVLNFLAMMFTQMFSNFFVLQIFPSKPNYYELNMNTSKAILSIWFNRNQNF